MKTLVVASLLFVSACSVARVPPSPVAIGPGRFALPAANWQRDGLTLSCAGTGWIGAQIHGSPDDPTVVWVISAGARLRVAWPFGGYVARFTPSLEVLDPSGNVILREGDSVGGGCQTADRGIWQVDP
jgi:hypothetical protein